MVAEGQLCLHVVTGIMQGTVAKFSVKQKVTIGRTRGNSFPIKDDTVSQRHSVIVHKKGQWVVTDSNSSNGTFINGVRVSPAVPTELRDGDVLTIGPEIEVKVRISTIKGHYGQNSELEEGKRRAELSSSQTLTVKGWFDHKKKGVAEENEVLAEASVREIMDYAEALKKDICETAGFEYTYTSIS